jgi:hypothetical protein
MPVGGNPFRIEWTATEPDLAAVDATNAKSMSDKFAESSAWCFPPGTAHDEMWRSL